LTWSYLNNEEEEGPVKNLGVDIRPFAGQQIHFV
jgi:hypothetical protein